MMARRSNPLQVSPQKRAALIRGAARRLEEHRAWLRSKGYGDDGVAKKLERNLEYLKANPEGSKGKFARCVKAVSKRGGAVDPRAVCGAMEKKYWGNPSRKEALEQTDPYAAGRAYAQMANANRYNPDRHAFLMFVRAWSKKHSPKNQQWITAKEAEQRIAEGFRDTFAPGGHRGNPEDAPNKRAFVGPRRKDGKYPVQLVYPLSGKRISKLMTADQVDRLRSEGYEVYGSRSNPAAGGAMEKKYRGNPLGTLEYQKRGRVILRAKDKLQKQWKAAHYSGKPTAAIEARLGKLDAQLQEMQSQYRGNPAAGAVQAYEEFHGRKPDDLVTVKRQIHIHRHLSGAGELRMMKVQSVDGKSIVKLSRFGNALLAFNEAKNQLFIEGGSQSVDLKAFGIRTQHEVETLGKVTTIDYFTRKDHLGSEGGTAVYRHKFRTVNEDGRTVVVKILRYPDLIYFVRDKHLVFSGGDYEILAEGIDK